jgi:acyl carrier protein
MNDNIADWIKTWFMDNAKLSLDELQSKQDSNYFDLGWIDSFQFIKLITDIEEHFKISFSNDEFQDRSFSSYSGLSRIIKSKINKNKKL